jgi:cysteine desulfurase
VSLFESLWTAVSEHSPSDEIYLDNHATTAVDPRVIDAMLPLMRSEYANAGSITHEPGRRIAAKIQECKEQMLGLLGASGGQLVLTSGATESINLALFGVALHPRQKRRRILVGKLEHRAVLDCAKKLARQGFLVQSLEAITHENSDQADQADQVDQAVSERPFRIGRIDIDALAEALDDEVCLVSILLGNNEIGTLQDMRPVADLCRARGAILHLDATQAVGKVPLGELSLQADLVSFSAHKFYGPKGVGGLLMTDPDLMLTPQIVGGGQQNNLRSGTLNTSGIVGMARALAIASESLESEMPRIYTLRDRLWQKLRTSIPGLRLNGPAWNKDFPTDPKDLYGLPGNLNVQFPGVDGQSLMLKVPGLAVSSGSACTAAEPHPSHVLTGIGLSQDQARCSLRFGIGRFNTSEQIDQAAKKLAWAYSQLIQFVA